MSQTPMAVRAGSSRGVDPVGEDPGCGLVGHEELGGSVAGGEKVLEQIAGVVEVLSEVAEDIPEGIDWIIRVDGHTDPAPIIAALREVGYDGYLSAEIFPQPDADAAARQTIASIRQHA